MTKPQNSELLFYTDQGHGEVVVLLHGFLEDHSMWDNFVTSLAKSARVICIDLPGHGKSRLSLESRMESFTADVFQVLDAIGAKTFKLIGHSMGGYVALSMAKMQPDRVLRLGLLNSTWKADSQERKEKRRQAIEVIRQDPQLFVKTVVPSLFPPKAQQKLNPIIEDLINKACTMSSEAIIAATQAMIHREDHGLLFQNLGKNGYLLVGQEDPLVDINELISAAKANKNQTEILETGHMSPFENIDKVLIFLTKFIL